MSDPFIAGKHIGTPGIFRSDVAAILLVIAGGLLIRLPLSAIVDISRQGGDSEYYMAVARNLMETGVHSHLPDGTPAAFRVPLYPLFLATLLGLGVGIPAVFTVQSLFTIAAAVGVFWMLRKTDRGLALIWAILVATSPFFMFFELRLLSEPLYVALVVIGWTLAFLAFERLSLMAGMFAGAVMALATLTRETLLLLPASLFLALVLYPSPLKRSRIAIMVMAAAMLVVLPWPMRNAALPGGQAQLSDGTLGKNLWVGTWEADSDWVHGGIPDYAYRSPEERVLIERAWANDDDDFLKQVAIERISEDPAGSIATWLARQHLMWLGTRSDLSELRLESGSTGWLMLKAGLFGLNLLVLILATAGAVIAFLSARRLLFFGLPILYTAAVYLPFHNAETRYSLVALPFAYFFVAVLFRTIAANWHKQSVEGVGWARRLGRTVRASFGARGGFEGGWLATPVPAPEVSEAGSPGGRDRRS